MASRVWAQAIAVSLLLLLMATDARAISQRTFVSSNGDDANPCSLILPCRSFSTAIDATQTGGEIIVVDSAGYGSVVVTKAVSIIAPPGIYAGVTQFFGTAIDVASTTAGPVVLRNLTIVGMGALDGIRYSGADELLLDGVSVSGIIQHGIFVSLGATDGNLVVKNSIIEANGEGIATDPFGTPGTAKINISGTLLVGNTTAISLRHKVSASIRDSTITGGDVAIDLNADVAGFAECVRCTINNTGNTAVRVSASGLVVLSNSSITDGAAEAIVANNSSVVRVSDTTITHNATGIGVSPSPGQVISYGNNRLFGNGTDGSFTSIAPMQ